jgi:predicted metalloprotease with PDZ domain
MRQILFFCASIVVAFSAFSQSIQYELRMPKPQSHYFQVVMELTNFKESELHIKMPVWAPGSYLVREFARNVDLVYATDETGKKWRLEKDAKNAWVLKTGKAKKIRVSYEVYSFELSVRTSFLDLTHGYVSGSGVFMYVDGHKERPGKLTIYPFSEFKTISTALPRNGEGVAADGSEQFMFENYDQLVDCPIEIGNQEVFEFVAAGVKHTVAMYGTGNYSVFELQEDMVKIVEAATDVFGQNPNKEYTFIVHNVVDGQGGLEHCNSTTLSVNRWTYQGKAYLDFLNLVAHEYFHLWNVKRIRPIELGPFNYDEENYTTLLWVMEGFTSYYDELLMRRAGYITESEYLAKLESTVNYVEGSVGARVQPVAHASFDAWIKAYRPNENSSNTTMTYYSRGAMLAAVIDAMIIEKYSGKKCLDHFMRVLYDKYYTKLKRGFSDKEFQFELSAFLDQDMTDFFNRYVYGTEMVPFDKYFGPAGVDVSFRKSTAPSFGAGLKQEGSRLTVRSVRSGSAAENAGLSVNDEIIGYNGFRVDQSSLEAFLASLEVGENMKLLVSRDQILLELTVVMTEFERAQFSFKGSTQVDREKLRKYWFRAI